jgi:hypothetical protein
LWVMHFGCTLLPHTRRFPSEFQLGADANVTVQDKTIWRAALRRRGKDWVARELQIRHGQPGDDVLDVVYEGPPPTREFCQKWCAEQENRMFVISGHTQAVIVALLVFIAVSVRAIVSWENYRPPQDATTRVAHGSGPAPTGWASTIPNSLSDPAPSTESGTSSAPSRVPGSCAYMTYHSAACPSR